MFYCVNAFYHTLFVKKTFEDINYTIDFNFSKKTMLNHNFPKIMVTLFNDYWSIDALTLVNDEEIFIIDSLP